MKLPLQIWIVGVTGCEGSLVTGVVVESLMES